MAREPEAVTALRHALGKQLATLRQTAQLTQAALAQATFCDRTRVAHLERGSARADEAFWQRADERCHADGVLLASFRHLDAVKQEHEMRKHEAQLAEMRTKAQAYQQQQAPFPAKRLPDPDETNDVRRRNFITAIAGLAASLPSVTQASQGTNRRDAAKLLGLLVASATQPALDAATRLGPVLRPRRVDRQLVLGHQEIAQAFAGLYRGADPRSVLPVAMSYADNVLSLLTAPMGDLERTELERIVAGIHAQIGLWACHMHRPAMAYRYLATACQVAQGTVDPTLQAQTLGAFSYFFSSAPRGGHGGDAGRAITLLTKALALTGNAHNFTVGWLATWRADQHATLGDVPAAQRDIELADQGLRSHDDDLTAGFFARPVYGYGMQEHCDSVRAFTLSLAGKTDEADRVFDQVQVNAANMRRRIATYGHHALAQVRANEPELACTALCQAVNLAVEHHYVMGLERAVGVRTGFASEWSTLNCVRELDEQLHLSAN
jgi:transcriptional regulator with XRE-family HTH domain